MKGYYFIITGYSDDQLSDFDEANISIELGNVLKEYDEEWSAAYNGPHTIIQGGRKTGVDKGARLLAKEYDWACLTFPKGWPRKGYATGIVNGKQVKVQHSDIEESICLAYPEDEHDSLTMGLIRDAISCGWELRINQWWS